MLFNELYVYSVVIVSSLPMHNVTRTVPPPLRVRSMSMVDYDLPACQRAAVAAGIAMGPGGSLINSGGKSGPPTPILISPVEEVGDGKQPQSPPPTSATPAPAMTAAN